MKKGGIGKGMAVALRRMGHKTSSSVRRHGGRVLREKAHAKEKGE